MVKIYWFVGILFCINTGCKTQRVPTETYLSIVDSLHAAQIIIVEDKDIYFEKLQTLELSIQMKNELGFSNRNQAVDSLKRYLQTQVNDFSKEDKIFIDSVFTTAKTMIKALYPSIMPDTIQLIMIKPGFFGEGVYFTRGKTIFFPKGVFEAKNFQKELTTMVHEIWHVISRLNPDLRNKTYPLIGFERHGKKLTMPVNLEKRLIINPDASFNDFAIDLNGTLAIPLLTSKFSKYTKDNPNFFDYIDFNLYQINKDNSVGTKGILDERTDVFFQKIKDNTSYIIHPEEIIAENFQLLVFANYEGKYDKFSTEGKELIMRLKEVLKE